MMHKYIIYFIFILFSKYIYSSGYINLSTLNGLSSDVVFDAIQDKHGIIWIATEYGLNKLTPDTLEIINDIHFFNSLQIRCFDYIESIDLLIIGTKHGVTIKYHDKFYKVDNDIINFPRQIIYSNNNLFFINDLYLLNKFNIQTKKCYKKIINTNVYKMLKINENEIYLLTNKNIIHFNTKQNKISVKYKFKKNIVKDIYYKNKLYILTEENIIFENDKDNKCENIKLPVKVNGIKNRILVNNQNIYVISDANVIIFSIVNKKFVKYDFCETIENNQLDITNTFYDLNNNLWICTFGSGIYCFNNQNVYTPKKLNNLFINSILNNNASKLYIASSNGFYSFNIKNDSLFKVFPSIGNIFVRNMYNWKNKYYISISNNNFNNKNYIEKIKFNNDSLYFIFSKYVYYDSINHTLIVDNYTDTINFYKFNSNYANDLIKYKKILKNEYFLVNNMFRDSNNYFIFCNNGIQISDTSFSSINYLFKNEQCSFMLFEEPFIYFTTDLGFFQLNRKNKSINSIFYYNTVKINKIFKVFDNAYAILTNKGIFIFQNKRLLELDNNILISKNITDLIKINNDYYISTSRGITIFNENHIKHLIPGILNNPKFYFNKISNGFKTQKRNITFKILVTDYLNVRKYNFKYKINNGKWYELSTSSIHINNLKPGQYTFYVSLNKGNNFWSEPIKLNFKIIPFWYETIYFKAFVYLIILIIIILFVTIFYSKSIKKIISNQLQSKQTRLLNVISQSNVINSHFVHNVLNTVQYFINIQDLKSASDYISKLSRLIRNVMRNSMEPMVPLSDELQIVNNYLEMENIRFNNQIHYTTNIDPDLNIYNVFIPNLIIQPLVENSIKHGFDSNINNLILNIRIKLSENKLKIIIEDNGIGINNSKSKKKNS